MKREHAKRKHGESEYSVEKCPAAISSMVVAPELAAGKIKRIFVRNFMCHEAYEIILNPNVNFIVGRNGSGKSALLTALTIGLGARAGITNRGTSVKEFIKKGKNSATIEIDIVNVGPLAFKPEEYGNVIRVVRQIGTTLGYKLKSVQGTVISTKKEELEELVNMMNIQIENPISVLNQDVSRTFLTTQNAADKYRLFMTATRMDMIMNNYTQAQIAADISAQRFDKVKSHLSDVKKEIMDLETSLKMMESVEAKKEQFHLLQLELCWANVIVEEEKLRSIEQTLAAQDKKLSDLRSIEEKQDITEQDLTSRIAKLRTEITEIEAETADVARAYQEAKEHHRVNKETFQNKVHEWKTSQAKTNRMKSDLELITRELARLENEEDRANLRNELAKLKEDLEEVEAMLRTKQTDQMHLTKDKACLEQEEQTARNELNKWEICVRKTKQELTSLRQKSDGLSMAFGADIPRVLKRIDEEHSKGRFEKKPIGPLGAYVKVKDSSWTLAVESYLGHGTLGAFACDNVRDAKILRTIMQPIYSRRDIPSIITSPFSPKVYDVRGHCTRADNYTNLFDIMEISNPVAANCLIDSREPECVLLIPSCKEGTEMFSDKCRVPRNCKLGVTKEADEFFPDPNYRCYSSEMRRPKLLQVSTPNAIKAVTEELATAEMELAAATKRHENIRTKLKQTLARLGELSKDIAKLRAIQQTSKTKIDNLTDKMYDEQPAGTALWITEKATIEKKLLEEKALEEPLKAEVEDMKKELQNLEAEIKSRRDVMFAVDGKVNALKGKIRELNDAKEMLKLDRERGACNCDEARLAIQKTRADYEAQKRITDKLVTEAEGQCPRMDTQRSVQEIRRISTTLKAKLGFIQKKLRSKESLESDLMTKREIYEQGAKNAADLEVADTKYRQCVVQRREMFNSVKERITQKLQTAFTSILRLRQYKGFININHSTKTLDMEVSSQNVANRSTKDARTLSGGERSYATVAFILALWDCMSLPFYFLDEFDVFMDKVNRRIIMDILLDHARTHPESQFAFFTPLETSIDLTDNYITIYKLAPPKRENDAVD